jgi:membrane-bound ClpP family serine protease
VQSNVIGERAQHGQRSWRDLSKRWLLFGLVLAPVLPIALGALILLLFGAGIFFTGLWPVLAAAEIWSMIGGTIFLLLSRWRGAVRRAHCLLLGAFLAFTLPTASMLTSRTIDAFTRTPQAEEFDAEELSFHGPADSTLVLLMGLILIPFGTLGGWVFWRCGVYPARPKVIDVAPVFD